MISMKLSKEEKTEQALGYMPEPDGPEYPRGLTISLDDDSLEKLGVTDLPSAGSSLTITAKCTVTSTSVNSREGGDSERNVGLQITDMEIVRHYLEGK